MDARNNVPFYAGIIPEHMDALTNDEIVHSFSQIPPTDKDNIREDYSKFVSKHICGELVKRAEYERRIGREEHSQIDNCEYVFEYTSGSSGTPFVTVKTLNERFLLAKALWSARNNLISIRATEAFNCNNPSSPLVNIENLIKNDYDMWMVNVNRLETIKKYCEINDTRLSKLKLIENAGSFITVEEQFAYEKFFNCIVSNYYGCTETWGIAYSCKNKNLHIMEDSVYVELLDENDNVIEENGRVGTVTVTSYILRQMPFIRYKTGDLAYYMPEKCECSNLRKVIRLVPNRNMILGTNLYGNNYFRGVLLKLIAEYKINKFKNISIMQTGLKTFDVNVTGCLVDKAALESGFNMAAKTVFQRDDYEFFFHYGQETVGKNIFTLSPYLLKRGSYPWKN